MKKWILWALVTIGVILFYQINYGLATLLPSNINWLMSARHDWGTHYLGWAFYKNEPWHFPLGKVTNYYYPLSTNVGFTDSIPLLAIFFKIFAPLLSDDFQYFGLWLFLCHLLTAYSVVLLLRLFKVNDLITLVAALFIATNPVLVYRGMHPALCTHWLLTGGIYLYFLSSRTVKTNKVLLYQFILLALSAMINPYLCWMVLGFTFAIPVKLCFFEKALSKKNLILYLAVSVFSVLLLWYLTGLIDFQKKEDLGVGGAYGLYAMNLNSLFNPYDYSSFLPHLPWVTAHQYEGYMYLGVGIILLLFIWFGGFLYTTIRRRSMNQVERTAPAKKDRSSWPLIVLAFIYAIIAITFVFTYNDKVLFRLPAPSLFIKMEEVFRACSRFFWMPYYLIILFVIIGISKWKTNPVIPSTIIVLAFIIQIYDVKALLRDRHLAYGPYNPSMENTAWIRVMSQFDEIVCVPPFNTPGTWPGGYQDICFLAMKARKPIDLAYVAREDSYGERRYTDSVRATVAFGRLSPGALYISSAKNIAEYSVPIKIGAARLHYLDGSYYYFSTERKSETLDTLTKRLDGMHKEILDSTIAADGQRTEFKAIPKTLIAAKHSIGNNMETIEYGEHFVSIRGWAVRDSTQDNTGDSVFLTLSSGDRSYWAPSGVGEREDVSSYYQGKGAKIRKAGVRFLGFTDSLPKGTYQLGITIRTSQGQYIHQQVDKDVKVNMLEYSVPAKLAALPPAGSIIYDIAVEEKPTQFSIGGWAALDQRDADNCTTKLILKSGSNIYTFETEPALRKDVTAYFKNKYRLDSSGYSVRIAKNSLPKGSYQLGFLIRDAQKKEYSMFIDKLLDIK